MLCLFCNAWTLRFFERIIQFLHKLPYGSYAIWDPLNTVIYNFYLQHCQHGCVINLDCVLGFSDFVYHLVFQHCAVFNINMFIIASNLPQILLLLNRYKTSIIWELNDSLWTSQNIEEQWYFLERYCWWMAAAGVNIEEYYRK